MVGLLWLSVKTFIMITMKKNDGTTPGRKMGRPLSFDREAALEKAMLTFWRHGYETTSITDLTEAMGITAPSIYAAFGDKKQLFLEAVRRYAGSNDQRAQAISSASSAYVAAQELLEVAATLFTGEITPPGCLLASATATGSAGAEDVRAAVTKIRTSGRSALRRRIEQDMEQGILPSQTDAEGLSDLVFAALQGMSALARDGASRAQLNAVARHVLAAWPNTEVRGGRP